MNPSNLLPQHSPYPTEKETEKVSEPEMVDNIKESRPSKKKKRNVTHKNSEIELL